MMNFRFVPRGLDLFLKSRINLGEPLGINREVPAAACAQRTHRDSGFQFAPANLQDFWFTPALFVAGRRPTNRSGGPIWRPGYPISVLGILVSRESPRHDAHHRQGQAH